MSTNISKKKREDLLVKIEEIRKYLKSNTYDENTQKLMGYLNELITQINGQKYGLLFEEHRESIDEKLENHLPVLTEEKDLFVGNNGEMNFLLEGDNLASLQLLKKTHKGKIDVIYIDPPYNTGNKDFIYDDDYVSDDDEFRHSKWLSFMKKRLIIAKKLLTDTGCILLSIDKNEGFQLKLLLDEIFGEESLAADLHVETSVIAGPRRFAAINGSVVKTAEFVFGYTKGNSKKVIKCPTYDSIGGFDTHYTLFWDKSEKKFYNFIDKINSSKEICSAFENSKLKVSLKNLGKLITINESVRKWLYSKEIASNLFRESDTDENVPQNEIEKHTKESLITYNDTFYRITAEKTANILFRYSDRIGQCDDYFQSFGERSIRGNLWKGFSADGGNIAKEGGVSFKNGKKPKRLIKQLLKTVSSSNELKNCTVLDFFAGSGTTGESVLDLNSEDGGHRKFILCTNNENNICRDITYQRLKTVITGKRKDGSKYSDGLPGSLKYFKVDFVPVAEKEYYEYADKLLLHVRELVELENAVDFENDKSVAIVLTEEEMVTFEKAVSTDACTTRTLYLGHDVLLSKEQKNLLMKNGIEIKIIPQYYYPELNG